MKFLILLQNKWNNSKYYHKNLNKNNNSKKNKILQKNAAIVNNLKTYKIYLFVQDVKQLIIVLKNVKNFIDQ